MIIDAQNTFSREQAVTAAAPSADVIDLGSARSIAIGGAQPLDILISCTETTVSAGATTVAFRLQESADNSTFTDLVSTPAIGKATLVAGFQTSIRIPPSQSRRYLRLFYDVAVANLTAGRFSAAIVDGLQANRHYPDAL